MSFELGCPVLPGHHHCKIIVPKGIDDKRCENISQRLAATLRSTFGSVLGSKLLLLVPHQDFLVVVAADKASLDRFASFAKDTLATILGPVLRSTRVHVQTAGAVNAAQLKDLLSPFGLISSIVLVNEFKTFSDYGTSARVTLLRLPGRDLPSVIPVSTFGASFNLVLDCNDGPSSSSGQHTHPLELSYSRTGGLPSFAAALGRRSAVSASEPATSSFESKLSTHVRLAAKERAS